MVLKASSLENTTLMRYGDINNDGKIDQKDLTLLQEFINGTKTPTQLQRELASVSGDRDGKLKQRDLELLKNYIDKQNGLTPDAGTDYNRAATGKTGVIYGIGDVTEAIEILASNSKVEIDMNHAQIYTNFNDDIFHIHNPEGLCLESGSGDIKLETYRDLIMKRFDSNAPTLKLTNNVMRFTDPNTPDLKYEWELKKDGTNQKAEYTIGKTIQQYDLTNKFFNILGNNTTRMNVYPQFYMQNSRNRCIGTLYFGADDGNDDNYFKRNEIQLDSNTSDNVELKMTDRYVYLKDANKGSTSSYFKVGGADDNNYVKINSNGNTEIKNTSGTAEIKFIGNSTANTARIWHEYNNNILHIDTNLHVKQDFTADGDGRFNGGDIYIKKQGGTSNLWFTDGTISHRIYHQNGENKLRVSCALDLGSNEIKTTGPGKFGTLYVGSNTSNYQLKVDGNGNLNTTGTITGSKVYGAVYNDIGEIFRKDEDEVIEYGDIVCLRDDGLVHKVSCEDDMYNIIGICSDTMGLQLGGADIPKEEQCEVGMLGKIWIKTDDVTIKKGDHLLANSDGKVIKTIKRSDIKFGIAMSDFKDGKVLVFIK